MHRTVQASRQLRDRASGELAARLPEHLGRLAWDRARLGAHQRDRLRALLRHAAANSPFHARRLAGIDVDRFEPGDLPRLPVMTKAEMMSEFVMSWSGRHPGSGRPAAARPVS